MYIYISSSNVSNCKHYLNCKEMISLKTEFFYSKSFMLGKCPNLSEMLKMAERKAFFPSE